MRAITVSEFGPPSVLQPSELQTPALAPNQVLVEVTGAGVGPWDAKRRQGLYGPQDFPFVPGAELSGIVSAAGAAVSNVAVGDSVFGGTGSLGCYAEYAAVDAAQLALAPDGLDLEAAGAVAIGATTALEGIDDHLHLAPNESILIAGAAGGVGTFVVQVAKARGARVVATASPENNEYLRRIGADEVLDYHGDWRSQAAGVDTAYDCVGGPTWEGCVQAVRDGGRAVTIAAHGELEGRPGVSVSNFSVSITSTRLAEIARLIDDQAVHVEISARLPLDDAARAHEMIETGRTRGKIVLLPG